MVGVNMTVASKSLVITRCDSPTHPASRASCSARIYNEPPEVGSREAQTRAQRWMTHGKDTALATPNGYGNTVPRTTEQQGGPMLSEARASASGYTT